MCQRWFLIWFHLISVVSNPSPVGAGNWTAEHQRYGIAEFNVPLYTLQVILETVLRVTWPNQQRRSTEGRWLVNHVKGQSHQAQLTKR